jgi:two-component system, chemotaxis family, CheB/CheR fusion protein
MSKNKKFSIVAIGASAGGLQAFLEFLKFLEPGLGYAYVFIQHLMSKHESVLPELLAKGTKIPVHIIDNDMRIEPDNIYIIPPGKYISLINGKFLLSQPDSSHKMPIDFFFRNLASEYKENAIGVILSGTANDGTLGLKEIKAEGGLTFVQDEISAEFKGMPHNAVKDLDVDYILPPGEIAKELEKLSKLSYPKETDNKTRKKTEKEDVTIKKIFKLLWNRTGVDFEHYKSNTINRRITRRMILHKTTGMPEYYEYMKDNPDEIDALYKDLLINVTHFFRDPDSFEVLKKIVYPVLESDHNSPIRIWIPGCSTGEEVYSIAISLLEYFGENSRRQIQIFATDISELALEKARSGIYPLSIVQDVSTNYLNKYFNNIDGSYQINRSIRDMIVFARQDITKDPPFSKIDLISCRNLLIYLSPVLQKRIIPMFHFALKPNGYLMLGNNETIGTFSDLFSLTERKHKIYTKKSSALRMNLNMNVEPYSIEKKVGKHSPLPGNDLQNEVDRIIMSQFALSGVLVNEEMEILLFRGDTSNYFVPSPGLASLNLYKLVRQDILLDLRALMLEVSKEKKPVKKSGINLRINAQSREISLEILPVNVPPGKNNKFLILFIEEQKTEAAQPSEDKDIPDNIYHELQTTREYLKSIIEQRESSSEELRSTMEELQSSNEELQSINEEMETAKEELQSTNEELTTVNDELNNRNTELTQLNNDLVNLLSSVNIPILVLDNELRIRRYTPVSEKIFKLIPSDLGRPVTDLRSNIKIGELESLIEEVLNSLSAKELEIQDYDNKWYSLRIRPYRTIDNKIDGVIVSLIDIDVIKKAYEEIKLAREFADSIIDTVREPLLILDDSLNIIKGNKSFYRFFRLLPAETEEQNFFSINNSVFNIPDLRKVLQNILPEKAVLDSLNIEAHFPNIGTKKLVLNARRIIQEGKTPLILLALEENGIENKL